MKLRDIKAKVDFIQKLVQQDCATHNDTEIETPYKIAPEMSATFQKAHSNFSIKPVPVTPLNKKLLAAAKSDSRAQLMTITEK